MEKFWHKKENPRLRAFDNIEDKFEAIFQYLSIESIICVIPDLKGFNIPPPLDKRFMVTGILAPMPNYTKSMMEEYRPELYNALEPFVSGELDYSEITSILKFLKERCEYLVAQNDPNNELAYVGNFNWYVEYDKNICPIPFYHLDFDREVYEILRLHFNLRMNFYEDLARMLADKLNDHLWIPSPDKSAYGWNSPNAELEVSELIFVLNHLAQRININTKAGGSFPKFRKQFFELFGLSDKDYSKKVDQVKKRKKNENFVTELADKFNAYHAKLYKPKK